jgi:glycosyltransferase involved in cell wall biosynthesis
LLTVAVPTCNGAAYLAETLNSILSQDCGPFDLLICDDDSDDDSVRIAGALAAGRAQVVVNENRLGLAGNWNQCMALSRTPWVNIFHQDDVMLPCNLASILEAIEGMDSTTAQIGIITGPVRVIDEHSHAVPESVIDPGGRVVSGRPPDAAQVIDFPPGAFAAKLRGENPLRCSAVIVNQAAHAALGGFDASYRYVVDWEFWHRLSRAYGVRWRHQDPSVLVRWHGASETHRFKSGVDDLEETARLLKGIFQQEAAPAPTSALCRKQADQRLCRGFLNRAHDALRAGDFALANLCLARASAISPLAVLKTLGGDPRFLVQMGTLKLAPRLAARWFARREA